MLSCTEGCIDDNLDRFIPLLSASGYEFNSDELLDFFKGVLFFGRGYFSNDTQIIGTNGINISDSDRIQQFKDADYIIRIMSDSAFMDTAKRFQIQIGVIGRVNRLLQIGVIGRVNRLLEKLKIDWELRTRNSLSYRDIQFDIVINLMTYGAFGEWVRQNVKNKRKDKEFKGPIPLIGANVSKIGNFYRTRFGIFHESGYCIDFFENGDFLTHKTVEGLEFGEHTLGKRTIYDVSYFIGRGHNLRQLLYDPTSGSAVMAYTNDGKLAYRIKNISSRDGQCLVDTAGLEIIDWSVVYDFNTSISRKKGTKWMKYTLGENDRIILQDSTSLVQSSEESDSGTAENIFSETVSPAQE